MWTWTMQQPERVVQMVGWDFERGGFINDVFLGVSLLCSLALVIASQFVLGARFHCLPRSTLTFILRIMMTVASPRPSLTPPRPLHGNRCQEDL